jgi:DNA polymerase III epsilon subunit-like protein
MPQCVAAQIAQILSHQPRAVRLSGDQALLAQRVRDSVSPRDWLMPPNRRVLFFDTESTGFSHDAQVLQLGWSLWVDGVEVQSYERVWRVTTTVQSEALALHGIDGARCRDEGADPAKELVQFAEIVRKLLAPVSCLSLATGIKAPPDGPTALEQPGAVSHRTGPVNKIQPRPGCSGACTGACACTDADDSGRNRGPGLCQGQGLEQGHGYGPEPGQGQKQERGQGQGRKQERGQGYRPEPERIQGQGQGQKQEWEQGQGQKRERKQEHGCGPDPERGLEQGQEQGDEHRCGGCASGDFGPGLLVAHSAAADEAALLKTARACGLRHFELPPAFCVYRAAMAVDPSVRGSSCKLQALRTVLSVPDTPVAAAGSAHTALADARTTAAVFFEGRRRRWW